MRERELAAILFEIGLDRGSSVEQIIDALGAMTWPAFVDADAVRAALGGAAEAQLRRQLDEQLALIRAKIGASRAPGYAPPPSPESVAPPYAAPLETPVTPAARSVPTEPTPIPAAGPLAEPALVGGAKGDAATDEDDFPSDATMVWTTQHGERQGSE